MNSVRDEELLWFLAQEGLDTTRRAHIAAQLRQDAALSARLRRLQQVLDAAALDCPPEPDQSRLSRIAAGVEARIVAERPARRAPAAGATGAASSASLPPSRAGGASAARRRRRAVAIIGGALAASLLLAVGFFAGRQSSDVSQPAPMAPIQQPLAGAPVLAADRVYAASMASHLDAARRALLTVSMEDSSALDAGNAELARSLLDDHRLYLAAAEHRGDQRLITLLREIEPVLIELANPAGAGDIPSRKGLVEFVDREDLIFQVRAAEVGLTSRTTTRI
ncbi:MAG: hypothetical protein KDJ14_06145 [Xanthomonadales bacterium]|nr:hypothetical protein [Xanthomonadales bacterium]